MKKGIKEKKLNNGEHIHFADKRLKKNKTRGP